MCLSFINWRNNQANVYQVKRPEQAPADKQMVNGETSGERGTEKFFPIIWEHVESFERLILEGNQEKVLISHLYIVLL